MYECFRCGLTFASQNVRYYDTAGDSVVSFCVCCIEEMVMCQLYAMDLTRQSKIVNDLERKRFEQHWHDKEFACK